ncbi:hypothetical protein LINPERHAP2_LOCUS26444 [Linum perenne]
MRSECPNRVQSRDKAMKVTWSDTESDDEEQAYMAHADHENSSCDEDSSAESEVHDFTLLNMTKEDIITAYVELSDYMHSVKLKYKQIKIKNLEIKNDISKLQERLTIAYHYDEPNKKLQIKTDNLKRQVGILEERLFYANLRKSNYGMSTFSEAMKSKKNVNKLYKARPRTVNQKKSRKCYYCSSYDHTSPMCTFNYSPKQRLPKRIWVPKTLTKCDCTDTSTNKP